MRTLVHLSDMHFGRVDRRVVSPRVHTIRGTSTDLLAVSGDLTQRAQRSQFVQARDLAARFLSPLEGYCRYITRDLEPLFQDQEMIVVGLNSAIAAVSRGRPVEQGTSDACGCATARGTLPRVVDVQVPPYTHRPLR